MKYNKSEIMTRAWRIFRSLKVTFSEALKSAWETVKVQANVDKSVNKKPVMTVGRLVEKMQAAIKADKGCYSAVSVFVGRKMYTFKNFEKLANMFGDKVITGRSTDKDNNGGYELIINVR